MIQKENDQNFIDNELENDRQQLEDEYKELFHKMEFIRQNELEMKRQAQKVDKQKNKNKEDKKRIYQQEKDMLI